MGARDLVFLASVEACHISGASLVIDDGRSAVLPARAHRNPRTEEARWFSSVH